MISPEDKKFIKDNLNEDVSKLALKGTNKFLLQQIAGRQKIQQKLPDFYQNLNLLLPPKLSIEQSSSEATAEYKSNLLSSFSGTSGVDLTGGLGIDTIYFSRFFEKFIYVEQNTDLCKIAQHNFHELSLHNIEIANTTSQDYLEKINNVDFIYADPARRNNNKKVFSLNDSSPNLIKLYDEIKTKSKRFIFKLSPMLDIDLIDNQLKSDLKFTVIKYQNENKELLVSNFGAKFNAIDLDNYIHSHYDNNKTKPNFCSTGNFIYEPNPEILKLSLATTIAEKFNLFQIAPNTNIYISNNLIQTPHFSIYKIISNSHISKNLISEIKGKKALVKSKNYFLSANEIRKKYLIKEGKDTYLFFFKDIHKKACLISASKIK